MWVSILKGGFDKKTSIPWLREKIKTRITTENKAWWWISSIPCQTICRLHHGYTIRFGNSWECCRLDNYKSCANNKTVKHMLASKQLDINTYWESWIIVHSHTHWVLIGLNMLFHIHQTNGILQNIMVDWVGRFVNYVQTIQCIHYAFCLLRVIWQIHMYVK